MGKPEKIRPTYILPEERTKGFFIDGEKVTLGEIAGAYQGGGDNLAVADQNGSLLQEADLVETAKRHRTNVKKVRAIVSIHLERSPEIEEKRGEAAIEAFLQEKISFLQTKACLKDNPAALQKIHDKLAEVSRSIAVAPNKTITKEKLEQISSLSNMANIVISEKTSDGKTLGPRDKIVARQIFFTLGALVIPLTEIGYDYALLDCIMFACAVGEPINMLKQLFLKEDDIRKDREMNEHIGERFAHIARENKQTISRGLLAARDVMEKTGSVTFYAWMWPHLTAEDIDRIYKSALSFSQDGAIDKSWWALESPNMLLICEEVSRRGGALIVTDIISLSLKNILDKEEFLRKVDLDKRSIDVLREVAANDGSPVVKAMALGHLTRLDPESYAQSAINFLRSPHSNLKEREALVWGLRKIGNHGEIRLALSNMLTEIREGRVDKDLTEDELRLVITMRETLIEMGVNVNEIIDPPDEINRRLRALGPKGTVIQRKEGVLGQEFYSEFRFIAQDENYLEIIRRDGEKLKSFGISFDEAAKPLSTIREHYVNTGNRHFEIEINNRTYSVSVYAFGRLKRAGWHQTCPFVDSTNVVEYDFKVTDPLTNKTFFFAGLLPHLIKVHHFFEGNIGDEDTTFRIEPEELIEFFRIPKK